jgi:hypothetical protein
MKEILRGDIWIVDLEPVRGSEQGGTRPCLVIQNDRGNKYSPTVIVAAITSRKKKVLPTHVQIDTDCLPYAVTEYKRMLFVPVHHPSCIHVYKRKRIDEYVSGLERVIQRLV